MTQPFYDILLEALVKYGAMMIGLIFTAVLGYVAQAFAKPLAKHLWLKGFFERVFAEAKDVVLEVNQTFVDRIRLAREDGIVTPEELAEARSMAFKKLKSNLGPKLLERAARALGYDDAAMDRMLGTKIEANVQRVNLIKSGALPPVSIDNSTTPAPRPPTSQR